MQQCTRSSIQLIKENDFSLRIRARVMARSIYIVILVESISAREIVHNIKVAYHRFIVPRRHK